MKNLYVLYPTKEVSVSDLVDLYGVNISDCIYYGDFRYRMMKSSYKVSRNVIHLKVRECNDYKEWLKDILEVLDA